MADSKTQIANMALSHIHAKDRIENIEVDTSAEGKEANIWYDQARKQALEAVNWDFARRRSVLSLHGNAAPTHDWSYRYIWPNDCIAPRYIENPAGNDEDAAPYTVEYADNGTRSILCDLAQATLVYTRNQENTGIFTPMFTLALSYLLAHYLAGPLTGKEAIKNNMLAAYTDTLWAASASEGNQTVKRRPRESEFIRGRQ